MLGVSHAAVKQVLKRTLKSGISSSAAEKTLRAAGLKLASGSADAARARASLDTVKKAFRALRAEGMTKGGVDSGMFYERTKRADAPPKKTNPAIAKQYLRERQQEEEAAQKRIDAARAPADAPARRPSPVPIQPLPIPPRPAAPRTSSSREPIAPAEPPKDLPID